MSTLILVLYTATSNIADKYCQEGYTRLSIPESSEGVICVKVYEHYLSWEGAQQHCNTDYSFLVTLDDAYISQFASIGRVQQTVLDYLSGYKGISFCSRKII